MCSALEELKKEGIEEGVQKGKIAGFIEASREFGLTKEVVEQKIIETYGLDVDKAAECMKMYWQYDFQQRKFCNMI